MSAHAPRYLTKQHTRPDTALFVPDGELSVATYGELSSAAPARLLAVRLPAGSHEPLELLVPRWQDPTRPPALAVQAPGSRGWQPVAALPEPEVSDETFVGTRY